jgi:tetratricopeptide (TPR) repeat protein
MGGAYTGDKFYSVLYANPGHLNHWIGLKLEGVRSNRGAVGARIHVSVKTKSGQRDIYRTVNSGGSFGANPLRQDIGLGDALAIESIDIRWPAAGVPSQHLGSVPMDRFYQIREGRSAAEPWSLPRFEYRTTPAIADGISPAPKKSAPLTPAVSKLAATPRNAAQSSKSNLARSDQLFSEGDVLAKSGDYQAAIARYAEAIAAAPKQSTPDAKLARTYRQRSAALLALNRDDEALDDINESIGLYSGDPEAFTLRRQLRLKKGQSAEGAADAQRALQLQLQRLSGAAP